MARYTHENLDRVFTYQPVTPEKAIKFAAVADASKALAAAIIDNCPECADKTHALRVLRDARMWANAAIALDGEI